MFKRFGLLLLVNFGIIITLSLVLNLLGVGHYVTRAGLDYEQLMIFCLVWGVLIFVRYLGFAGLPE